MIEKELSIIEESDLDGLVTNSVSESKTLEYKSQLKIYSDKEKLEFLKDVSALANSAGGDLIFGVDEEKGIAKSVSGIDIDDPDRLGLQIEDILRYGVRPRILNISIHIFKVHNDKFAIIIRIPRSWFNPHRIVFKGNDKFYLRKSSGSYSMDVDELRIAFTGNEAIYKSIENFKLERISKILEDLTPVSLVDGPKVVLHLIPLSSFKDIKEIDLKYVSSDPINKLNPIYARTNDWRYNLDGFLVYSNDKERYRSYVQLFRNGIIEAVNASLIRPIDKEQIIKDITFESTIIKSFSEYKKLLKELNVELPIIISVTLLEVKGYYMGKGTRIFFKDEQVYAIDRDHLFLPELLMENYEQKEDLLLKTIFDSIWNACGMERSLNYDIKTGNWNR